MIDREISHYRITARLGSGGMGEVYRAVDTKLGRAVALKLLPEKMATDPERLARFAREATTVAGLNHPNIVTLHSVDHADGLHFLTMELVEGKTLDRLVPEGGVPIERIFELAIPIADALASAHSRGVVHRDLKPGNVMVTDEGGWVKVLDFGLAKLAAPDVEGDAARAETLTTTREGKVVGTPHYMSPEQARGEEVDPRSDLFSFGVMLFELATGRRPFHGVNSIELLSSVLKDDPPDATEIRPELPAELESVIRRCLEKNPDDRYQSADDLLADLRALQLEVTSGASYPSMARMPSRPGAAARRPGSRRTGRRRALAIGGGVLVLTAAAALWLLGKPFERAAAPRVDTSRPIVAVLPFENLGNADDQYFADGVTDEITSRLALIPDLGVISRTSSRVYAGTTRSAREIGAELNADYILEGTVRWDRSANQERVRITPRLVRAADDTQVWADNYEREITEIFAVQADIAERIAEELDVNVVAHERRALTARPTESIEAYRAYLKGVEQIEKPGFSRDSFELGERMFERATTLDPDFALAWARLSSVHSRIYHYGFDLSEARLQRALEAAKRALALQPDLAEAHLALAQYYYWGRLDYPRALASLEDARRFNPNIGEIRLTTAYVKRRQGDFEGAIELFERDRELSPLDPNAAVGLGETYGTLRRWAEGEAALERGIALAPDDPYPYTELALLYLRWRGDTAKARATLRRMPPVVNTETCRVGFLVELADRRYDAAMERLATCPAEVLEAGIFAKPVALLEGMTLQLAGDPERARAAYEKSREILEERLANDPEDYRVHAALGLTYAGLGRAQEAVRHGRRAVELYPMSRDALQAPSLGIDLALVYTMTGDAGAAIDELDSVLSVPSILSVAWLEKDPRWDPLRDSPGYADLLRR